MTIVHHENWDLSNKGKKDIERHQQKIDNVIRKNIKNVIGEETIITKRHGKKIKIPIRGLEDYKFIYGFDNKKLGGIGQGKGKEGDVFKKYPVNNGPGNIDGSDYIETEIDINYIIDLMFEDLGLPYIEERTKIEQVIPKGWKFNSITKTGIKSRIHKHKTLKESIKRTLMYVKEIISETGCTEDIANKALIQSKGDLDKAINIVNNNEVCDDIQDMIFIEDDDLRYKQIEEDVEYHSNAVVIAMIDTSGSMDINKKYLARSMLFWLTEFLKKTYKHVNIKFITHTTDAKVVDEEVFFKKGESGGTNCHTAFDLADHLIETEFPVNEWNVYCVYVGDGEDWESEKTINSVNKLLNRKINMLAYCETNPDDIGGYPSYRTLLDSFRNRFNFKIRTENGNNYYKNDKKHFLACRIDKKEDIYPCLKHILFTKDQ